MLYCKPMLKTLLEKSRYLTVVAVALIAFGHYGEKD